MPGKSFVILDSMLRLYVGFLLIISILFLCSCLLMIALLINFGSIKQVISSFKIFDFYIFFINFVASLLYNMKRYLFILVLGLLILSSEASPLMPQESDTTKLRVLRNIQYKVEMQGSFSGNKTPLWLNANRYGLSSLEKVNGYIRGTINSQ